MWINMWKYLTLSILYSQTNLFSDLLIFTGTSLPYGSEIEGGNKEKIDTKNINLIKIMIS